MSDFKELASNPDFKTYRLLTGDGIRFAYCVYQETSTTLHDNGYVSLAEICGSQS